MIIKAIRRPNAMQSGDPLDNPQISSQKIAVMSIEKHIA